MRNPVPTSYRDWHGHEEEKLTEWSHFDTSSQLCFLEWLNGYTWSFRGVFVFHNRQSTRNTFLPNSTRWKRFFFPLFDRLVCTIHNEQILDELIKYMSPNITFYIVANWKFV